MIYVYRIDRVNGESHELTFPGVLPFSNHTELDAFVKEKEFAENPDPRDRLLKHRMINTTYFETPEPITDEEIRFKVEEYTTS